MVGGETWVLGGVARAVRADGSCGRRVTTLALSLPQKGKLLSTTATTTTTTTVVPSSVSLKTLCRFIYEWGRVIAPFTSSVLIPATLFRGENSKS